MATVNRRRVAEQWELLDIYRDRYPIEHLLGEVDSLKRSIERRRLKRGSIRRRVEELEKMLADARTELDAVMAEIQGSLSVGSLLIDEILDKVREDNAERWSPTPIRGFRVWRVQPEAVWGSQVAWHQPILTSKCLRSVPGEDVPHSVTRCGPPACGIYAVKSLEMFPPDVASCQFRDMAVGVVALTGKVIEHDLGYRAARAKAVAVAVHFEGKRLAIRRENELRALFRNPAETVARLKAKSDSSPEETRAFLEQVQKEDPWI